MNIIITFILLALPYSIYAQCNVQKLESMINVDVVVTKEGVKAGGDPGYMDVVTIKASNSINNIPLVAMLLTKGEVAAFWIPLEFEVKGKTAIATFSGYKEEIKNYEIAVYFETNHCKFSQQKMVYAYNKSLKQTD